VTQPTMSFSLTPSSWPCDLHGEYAMMLDDGIHPQNICPACAREQNDRRETWRADWRLHRCWKTCGIPERFRNRSFHNYRSSTANKRAAAIASGYAERFPEQYAQGVGLLLTGDLGTGKTHLAVATLTEVMRSGRTGAFISTTELLAAKKPGYSGSITDTAKFATVDLLVLDDVGATRGTDWEIGIHADLLNARYDDRLPTIITTNTPNLAAFVGDRAIDRFEESKLTVRLVGESYRRRVPDDEVLRASPFAIPEPPLEFKAELWSSGKVITRRYVMTAKGDEKIVCAS